MIQTQPFKDKTLKMVHITLLCTNLFQFDCETSNYTYRM